METDLEPFGIYFEITDLCNMSCSMCITRGHRRGKTSEHLTRQDIRNKILEPGLDIGLHTFVISGGESTLSKHLVGTINDAIKLNYAVYLASNLLKFDPNVFKIILMLLNHERHAIQVSFDSLNAAEMNKIRGRNVFKEVVKNCRNIVQIRDDLGVATTLVATLVMQPDNITSVTNTLKFILNDLKFDKAIVQLIHTYPTVTLNNYNKQIFPIYDNITLKKFIEASKMVFRMAENDERIIPSRGELQEWIQFFHNPLKIKKKCLSYNLIYIDAYGNFRGCLSGEILGNINNMSIRKYLNSDRYKDFLTLVQSCTLCVHGCS